VVLVFVTRDVLFLQWCMLTRLRQPVVKGVLYLGLYYAAAAVLIVLATVSSPNAGQWMTALLTPVQSFASHVQGLAFPMETYVGLVVQMVAISAVLVAIDGRLQRQMRLASAG